MGLASFNRNRRIEALRVQCIELDIPCGDFGSQEHLYVEAIAETLRQLGGVTEIPEGAVVIDDDLTDEDVEKLEALAKAKILLDGDDAAQTPDEPTDAEIRAKAKELGISHWHVKGIENLKAEIADLKGE